MSRLDAMLNLLVETKSSFVKTVRAAKDKFQEADEVKDSEHKNSDIFHPRRSEDEQHNESDRMIAEFITYIGRETKYKEDNEMKVFVKTGMQLVLHLEVLTHPQY